MMSPAEGFNGTVDHLKVEDLPAIKPILETWVRDRTTHDLLPDEVREDLEIMENSTHGMNGHKFFVARSESGEVIGVMGLKIPSPTMQKYCKTTYGLELVNAYVSSEHRSNGEIKKSKGVGRALVNQLVEFCKAAGYAEIVLNSGPRYRDTAWAFYNKIFGEPIAIEEGLYGPGGDAPIWRMEIEL